jgi:hypothetical protein
MHPLLLDYDSVWVKSHIEDLNRTGAPSRARTSRKRREPRHYVMPRSFLLHFTKGLIG